MLFINRKSQINNRQSGQGLLLAVLIMLLVALVGAAFVGVISFNLAQSARHEDVVKADAMAKAGVEYADEQLTHSTDGADWRPPLNPTAVDTGQPNGVKSGYYDEIETARGWSDGKYIKFPDPLDPDPSAISNPDFGGGRFLLKVEYPGGSSGSETEKYIRITSVGRSTNNPAVFKERVAYKPVTLIGYATFITNYDSATGAFKTTATTSALGTDASIDMDGDNQKVNSTEDTDGDEVLQESESFTTEITGPIRVNGNLEWNGNVLIRLLTGTRDWSGVVDSQMPKRDDKVLVSGTALSTAPVQHDSTAAVQVKINDAAAQTAFASNDTVNGFNTVSDRYLDGWGRLTQDRSITPSRWVIPQKPEVFAQEVPGQDAPKFLRFEELTRYSDNSLLGTSGTTKGEAGLAGFSSGGIYINNKSDIQFPGDSGTVRRAKLVNQWLNPQDSTYDTEATKQWKNHLEYVPKGVEMLLRDDEIAPNGDDLNNNSTHPYTNAPHNQGYPILWLRRNDGVAWKDSTGTDLSEKTISLDYPANGVLLAAGNLRIKGKLPVSFRKVDNTTVITRNFNLTVVSGGTIYIEGSILTPKSSGKVANDTSSMDDERRNTHIAILAKDHICINTTQFMSLPLDNLGTTEPTGMPNKDDAPGENGNYSHWTFNNPGSVTLTRQFMYGQAVVNPKLTLRYGGEMLVKYTGDASTATLRCKNAGQQKLETMLSGDQTDGSGNLTYDFTDTNYDTIGEIQSALDIPTPDKYDALQFLGFSAADASNRLAPLTATDIKDQPLPVPWLTKMNIIVNSAVIGGGSQPTYGQDFSGRYLTFDLPSSTANSAGGVNNITIAQDSNGTANYKHRLARYKLEQFDSGNKLKQGLDIEIDALMYAQEGTFFVIPGVAFDDTAKNFSDATRQDWGVRFRRYNYAIRVLGGIAENYSADVSTTAANELNTTKWTERWSYPEFVNDLGGTGENGYRWKGIQIFYDTELLTPRDSSSGTPKLPKLPLSEGLVYVG